MGDKRLRDTDRAKRQEKRPRPKVNSSFKPSDCVWIPDVRKQKPTTPAYLASEKFKKLSLSQRKAVELIYNGSNIFLTGHPGTGKSFLLKYVITILREKFGFSKVGVTASTGLAALYIEGDTLHSFSGVGLYKKHDIGLYNKLQRNNAVKRWRQLKVLLIDEISMIEADFFALLDRVAKTLRNNPEPFGGIQLVLSGDFFQLPPVSVDMSSRAKYCFESKCWADCIQQVIVLEQNYRQRGDILFDSLLRHLRTGVLQPADIEQLRALEENRLDEIPPIELYGTRSEASEANISRLESLPGRLWKYKSIDSGPKEHINKLSYLLAPKHLELKVGCQVTALKNDRASGISNGLTGLICFFTTESIWRNVQSKFTPQEMENPSFAKNGQKYIQRLHEEWSGIWTTDAEYPIVKFADMGITKVVLMKPEKFIIDNSTMSEPVIRVQLPLMLSWAISIHKAQGMTLQKLKVDASRIFERGQLYVALSRARSLKHIELVGFDGELIKPAQEVTEFYRNLGCLAV